MRTDVLGKAQDKYRLDPVSAKALEFKVDEACRNRDRVLFDDRLLPVLIDRAKNPQWVVEEREYLRTLKDEKGLPFSRSLVRHEVAKAQLENYLKPDPPNKMWQHNVKDGYQRVYTRYTNGVHLRMVRYHTNDDISAVVPRKTTSTGFSAVNSPGKWKKKFEALESPELVPWLASRVEQAKADGTFNEPLLPITRGQVSGAYNEDGSRTGTCKVKLRYAMNVAADISFTEAQIIYPVEEHFVKTYPYSAIGKSDRYITEFVNGQRSLQRSFLSVDYSKFDSTIPAWLIHAAFTIIRAMFDDLDQRLFDVLEYDFTHKTLLLSDEMMEIHHGTASGSRFTSIVNGIVNEIITEAVFSRFNLTGMYMCMGDDNLIFVKGPMPDDLVHNISDYISSVFGIKVHPEKCNWGDYHSYPKFLSRIWKETGPWRPMGEILGLALHPEYYRDYDAVDVDGKHLLTPEDVFEGYWIAYPDNFRDFMKYEYWSKGFTALDPSVEWSQAKLATQSWHVQQWYERERAIYLYRSQMHGEWGRTESRIA